MTDDVVAELDRWLAVGAAILPRRFDVAVLERARDEIIALRRTIRLGPDLPALAREEALEDCIRICPECADRIRRLKDG